MNNRKIPIHAIIEIVFDVVYLFLAITFGIIMLVMAEKDNMSLILYGIMALVLGFGDLFHLVPRIYGLKYNKMNELTRALGIGKLITSITMTVFYLLLYFVWASVYNVKFINKVSIILFILSIVRIGLVLSKKNRWEDKDSPLNFAIYRNIPFFLMGGIIIFLFVVTSWKSKDFFMFMPIAIMLSFLFYTPVVLFANKNPKIGALMLPKTMVYIWIIFMGFSLI